MLTKAMGKKASLFRVGDIVLVIRTKREPSSSGIPLTHGHWRMTGDWTRRVFPATCNASRSSLAVVVDKSSVEVDADIGLDCAGDILQKTLLSWDRLLRTMLSHKYDE